MTQFELAYRSLLQKFFAKRIDVMMTSTSLKGSSKGICAIPSKNVYIEFEFRKDALVGYTVRSATDFKWDGRDRISYTESDTFPPFPASTEADLFVKLATFGIF